jgi:hypothetical protein
VNEFLPARFAERVERLVLGIEPTDVQRGTRVAHPLDVVLDHRSFAPVRRTWATALGLDDAIGMRTPVPRHRSCRHSLVFPPAYDSPIAIRLFDGTRRLVARRISYAVPAQVAAASPPVRVRRPALFPGAAYDVAHTATGIRGRVTWKQSAVNEVPARWVRVEARIGTRVVGRAHGDDRGEFLLLLRNDAAGLGDLPSPLVAQVTVFGPAAPLPVAPDDPLSDLPLETVAADPDEVSAGEKLPPGYASTAASTRAVTFELGRLLTNVDKFFFAP